MNHCYTNTRTYTNAIQQFFKSHIFSLCPSMSDVRIIYFLTQHDQENNNEADAEKKKANYQKNWLTPPINGLGGIKFYSGICEAIMAANKPWNATQNPSLVPSLEMIGAPLPRMHSWHAKGKCSLYFYLMILNTWNVLIVACLCHVPLYSAENTPL